MENERTKMGNVFPKVLNAFASEYSSFTRSPIICASNPSFQTLTGQPHQSDNCVPMTKLIRNGIEEDEGYHSKEIIEEIRSMIIMVSNFKRSEFENVEASRKESKSDESETESSEEDFFGLCMAEDYSEDDEFIMTVPFKQSEKKTDETMNESSLIHSTASSCSSSSESFSSTCLTSSQTLVFEDNSHDSLEDSMEDGTDEIEYGTDDVEVLFSNQKISFISRLEPEKEK
ncbi:uncharacterized protein MONOS_6383 [Monocercomonoides exilis]|uniref:uncharacterized protein n=1 Tax=Monocercomonoides exilis TaxID=2049356 RepID=UPI00355AC93C|nr:hypothetical protein MONOS_6383 [Monocercomonoides exilis]|eukprot:MONOS_6383.1-p1 / transcript=MONOS_6383.1 / gene=MONOS_6383 / organism=Monocercomonoides_exilis_PA203 / gene_product=unspecified product / transcript_product=unspecified product / location=Mono_scaffold00200:61116-62153(+) / protein_length=230 / sequence_SO=supercontig / SO=protein_coding / is_pseudo=false